MMRRIADDGPCVVVRIGLKQSNHDFREQGQEREQEQDQEQERIFF
ncbi:hypothetical protein N9L19_00950 [bacterium]|nr:hypothetical protein [bacterium]